MGVPGLWDVLRPAGKTRSLTHLAVVDGFKANPDGKRGFRVGIDASIWFYHATYGREGENPELRTLFFRCARLMTMPFLPLFVFDGPKRPEIKRGKRITGKNHWMVQGMQEIISAFGFEWRMAPGEAEAELAYLNRIGVIDAVLSDDVDTFLFGAKMVVRNPSTTLSGNRAHSLKNAAGKDDGNHSMTYTSADILSLSEVQLTQGGLILIGVLRGGDYSDGLHGCGVATAHGLAKAGFGDTLLQAARTLSREALEDFLDEWREDVGLELRTNKSGKLQRKSPTLAKSIDSTFPNVDVLLSYTNPITSEAKGPGHKNAVVDWDKEPDLGKIAGLCEMYFEWGVKPIIIKRFRTVLWPSAVLRIIRRAAIIKERNGRACTMRNAVPETPRKNGKEHRAPPGTPSSMIVKHFSAMTLSSPSGSKAEGSDGGEDDEERLIVKIHSSRRHPSTDNVLEYRLEVAPAQLVRLCEAGIKGLRTELPPDLSDSDDGGDDDEGGKKTKKPPPHPDSHLRIWLPACMVEAVEPEMVDEFEGVQKTKADKKAGKAMGKSKEKQKQGSAAITKKAKLPAVAIVREEDGESTDSERHPASPVTTKVATSVRSNVAQGSGVSKSKPAVDSSRSDDCFAAPKSSSTAKATQVNTESAKINDFFVAKKSVTSRTTKATSSTTKVADLFRNMVVDENTHENPPSSSRSTTSRSHTSVSSSLRSAAAPSRTSTVLGFLDSQPVSSVPPARAPLPKPVRPPSLRPFPMDLEALRSNTTPLAAQKEQEMNPFAPGDAAPPSELPSCSTRARPRSTLSTTDSDASHPASASSRLQKSPRRSGKHTSPRTTSRKEKEAVRGSTPRKEGGAGGSSSSSSDSDSDRPPSPSPFKGRLAGMLPTAHRPHVPSASQQQQEVQEDAPSPSLARRKVLVAAGMNESAARPRAGRRLPPLPADLSIISVSSDSVSSDSEGGDLSPARALLALPKKNVVPLLVAKGRVAKKASTQPARQSATTHGSRRQIYDHDDIIDLT